MKGQRLFLIEESKIRDYLIQEKDHEVKYRIAFLHAFIKDGYDLARACDIFGIAIPTGYAWIKKWNQYGYEGIVHPFHTSNNPVGRPPILDDDDIETLKMLLGAKDDWQVKEVRAIITDTWGIELSESQVGRILKKRLGMHFSKPYRHDYRRPDDAEEQLKESVHKSINSLINKKIDKEDIAIGFLDEASPQTTANTARVWHFGNHVDVERDTTKYRANAIGFYAIQGNSVKDFLPNSKQESIEMFLEKIRSENRRYKAVIVILDNFSSHHSKLVQDAAAAMDIELVYLPPYSPEINPIGYIWKTVKRSVSKEFAASLTQLREVISRTWKDSSNKCSYAKYWIDRFVPTIIKYRELCS